MKKYKNIIFDLDGTLYPPNAGLMQQWQGRGELFAKEKLGLNDNEIVALQEKCVQNKCSFCAGLVIKKEVDPLKYWEFVFDVNYDFLKPSRYLDQTLGAINADKFIFSNGTHRHIGRVLEKLGIRRHFKDVFALEDSYCAGKPNIRSYDLMLEKFNIDPSQTVFIDDFLKNLKPATEMKMDTVWLDHEDIVGKNNVNIAHMTAITSQTTHLKFFMRHMIKGQKEIK
ncbi:MAG: HAD-IA family hydrolase [Lactobacillales bacterium]|nr:HAD-IA family hydrolase [Lactobacillales bacterium]